AGVRGRDEGASGHAAAAPAEFRDAGHLAVCGGFTRDLRGGRGGGSVDRRRRPAAGGAAGAHRRALWTGEDVVSDALLDIAGIRVGYPVPGGKARVVVDALSMTLAAGDIGCLLGASGCGKTTVLRAVAGFEPVQAGSIDVDGVRVAAAGLSLPP